GGEGPDIEGVRLASGSVAEWLGRHAEGPVGMALLDEWKLGSGTVHALALARPDGPAAHIDPTDLDTDDERALAGWLADPDRPKVVHGAKQARRVLAEHGWETAGITMDTALAAYLIQPGRRSFDLEGLGLEFLGREPVAAGGTDGQLALDADEHAESEALMRRARTVLDLGTALDERLREVGAEELLHDMELPVSDLLARMERAGIAADRERLERLEQQFAAAVRQAVEDAHTAVGHEFNLGSPKQLQEVLFGELGLPRTKKTKTGWTTDADALMYLTESERHATAEVVAPDPLAPAHRLVNGVPERSDPRTGEPGRPPTILFAARVQRVKRPRDFVTAMPTVLEKVPDARFLMAGPDTGPLAEEMLALADRLGVGDSLEYLGALDHDELLLRMREADVYVLPSTFEPFAVSILEAMSVGLPVVVTRTGGLSPDVAASGAGRVVDSDPAEDADNGGAVGRAILELLEPEAHAEASAAGPALIAERFTDGIVADTLRGIYRDVLARRTAG
ncbi:DNA polymerase, partial [Streptomyces alkaliphilus]|uniref:DNA polymerase n=1 Tax=Streptomyces alkaliphilus TaxID=1472722 RepID=UPI0011805DF3